MVRFWQSYNFAFVLLVGLIYWLGPGWSLIVRFGFRSWAETGSVGSWLELDLPDHRPSHVVAWLPHHQSQEVGLELVEHQKIFDKSRRNLKFALERQERRLKDCVGNQDLRSFMLCLSNDDFTLCRLILFG